MNTWKDTHIYLPKDKIILPSPLVFFPRLFSKLVWVRFTQMYYSLSLVCVLFQEKTLPVSLWWLQRQGSQCTTRLGQFRMFWHLVDFLLIVKMLLDNNVRSRRAIIGWEWPDYRPIHSCKDIIYINTNIAPHIERWNIVSPLRPSIKNTSLKSRVTEFQQAPTDVILVHYTHTEIQHWNDQWFDDNSSTWAGSRPTLSPW